ncbi:MAG: RNA polymerase sigma factor [Acidobacteriota bacterium]
MTDLSAGSTYRRLTGIGRWLLPKLGVAESDREDVVQSSWLRIHRRYSDDRERRRLPDAYLITTVKNEVIDRRRKGRWEAELDPAIEPPGIRVPPTRGDLGRAIHECLAAIAQRRPKLVDVLQLDILGFKQREIRQVLGLGQRVVDNRLTAGRKLLRECLHEKGFGPS